MCTWIGRNFEWNSSLVYYHMTYFVKEYLQASPQISNTNIPNNQGIDACCHFLDICPNKHIPTETLCDLLRMILISHLTNSIIFKAMVLLWVLKWLLLLLTFFLVCSKPTLSLTPLGSLTHGGDISMIFSWSGQKVRIVWKYSSIISITFIPLLSSLALTHLLTFLFSTSWCLYITV